MAGSGDSDEQALMTRMEENDYFVIHEIYHSENAQEIFENALENALENGHEFIIIEPTKIGDETARWIKLGNCLHKTAVLSGLTSIVSALLLPSMHSGGVPSVLTLSTGALSLSCATLYGISWQFDPCCKYQVECDPQNLTDLPLHTLRSTSPVVLVRKDDRYRKVFQNIVAVTAAAHCVYIVYQWYSK